MSDEALIRIRQICEKPYKLKHGRPLTWERGWVWEMVAFIHHTVDLAYPPSTAPAAGNRISGGKGTT